MCKFACKVRADDLKLNDRVMSKLSWEKANLEMYKSVVSKTLADINLPLDALLCKDSDCQSHTDMLNLYYTSIVHGLNTSATQCVPSVKVGLQKFWWTPELDELKQQCIDISTLWASVGRPCSGSINEERLRCKYRYKQAIKTAMQKSGSLFNDKLYDHLCQKNEVSFWKAWRNRFCVNKINPTNTQNGKTAIGNVLSEFTNYYKDTVSPHTAAANEAIASEVDRLLRETWKGVL